MRRLLTALAVAVAIVAPAAAFAAGPNASQYLGKILLDVGRHGEAYYVNPATSQRVFLGRPAEALDRLTKRAKPVAFSDIERVALEGQTGGDAVYTASMAGSILTPNDLFGAAWYVHPVLAMRIRLATADDAWQLMRAGTPTPSAVIDAIPSEPTEVAPTPAGEHSVTSVESAAVVRLDDGTRVRLIGVDVPSNPDLQTKAMSEIQSVATAQCDVQGDQQDADADGTKLRWLVCGEANLNTDLVSHGLAFHNVGVPNLKYAEQMVVAGLDAQRLGVGFWAKK